MESEVEKKKKKRPELYVDLSTVQSMHTPNGYTCKLDQTSVLNLVTDLKKKKNED